MKNLIANPCRPKLDLSKTYLRVENKLVLVKLITFDDRHFHAVDAFKAAIHGKAVSTAISSQHT